jgi:hypothetical protein
MAITAGQELAVLKRAFEGTDPLFRLLATVRSRRVGLGYRIEPGEEERHPVTGRRMFQERGPLAFKSEKEPVPLSEAEEALLCWAACGPNGVIAWDIAVHGGFHELTWLAGRTVPSPGNSLATDLLVINDRGAFIYKPGLQRGKPVEIEGEEDYGKVLQWYRQGLVQIADRRPDVDWALRLPAAPHATLMGPYQYNINRPGSSWLIPITDAAWLNSALINLFDWWHYYPVDEWQGGRPAGVEPWLGEGMLELPVPISALEQLIFQVEMYPVGCMVQNIRLAAEALGLGSWVFCGFNPDVILGAYPEAARGLGFQVAEPNSKAPVASGQLKIFGLAGVKEATFVPSPRYPDARALVDDWYREKYGPGGVFAEGEDNYIRRVGAPWKRETAEAIIGHPRNRPAPWVREALIAYIDYCVAHYGQWPVTYNPMQAHFCAVVHHLDTDFYDRYYVPGYVTERIRRHFQDWH